MAVATRSHGHGFRVSLRSPGMTFTGLNSLLNPDQIRLCFVAMLFQIAHEWRSTGADIGVIAL